MAMYLPLQLVALAAALLGKSSIEPVSAAETSVRASAVFAGGCFWCTEADFDKIPGVVATTSGYTGGKVANPNYELVSAGGTGHIEAVRVVYNPRIVSYATLVSRFYSTIDPTDAGGQFCDRGYQYRSAIFYANSEQQQIAAQANKRAARALKKQVATLLLPAARFYPAEGYHQDYYKKNPVRYRYYRFTCGRDARLKRVWGRS